jgi:hypothetical protein
MICTARELSSSGVAISAFAVPAKAATDIASNRVAGSVLAVQVMTDPQGAV